MLGVVPTEFVLLLYQNDPIGGAKTMDGLMQLVNATSWLEACDV